MQRAGDYLFLSVLAYCNFEESDYKKTIKEIYAENSVEKLTVYGYIFCTPKTYHLFFDFFKDILEKWEVFYVENKRANSGIKEASGFYGVVFRNRDEDKYVIAYRGSEKFPIEDAYKDFIENDLKLGLGEKPVQFYDGIELFNKMYKGFDIPREKLSITGHSLGGGIAQFVGLMIDKRWGFIPEIYTWNAVGIKRDGIINIVDFFDYNTILENLNLNDAEKEYFRGFKNEYLSFLLRELKKNRIVRDNTTLLKTKNIEEVFKIDDAFIKNFLKTTKFEEILDRLSDDTREDLLQDNKIFYIFFEVKNIMEELLNAQVFIKKIKANKYYEEDIINICHSKDMTASLFAHVGAVYLIDKNRIKKTSEKNTLFLKFLIFTKAVEKYHYQDVFFPFLEMEGDGRGLFSSSLSIDYLASIIRKIFALEYSVENELLADYYSLISITDKNFKQTKTGVLDAIKGSGNDILYKDVAYKQIKEMDKDTFTKLWESLKIKLPSPYRKQDIYDIIFD